jgi:hypothetical protein
MPARVWLWILVPLSIAGLWGIHLYRLGTLEQAIACDQFKHLPNGAWIVVKDFSVSYARRVGQYNLSYGKGTTVTGRGDSEGAHLLSALNEVCG